MITQRGICREIAPGPKNDAELGYFLFSCYFG
jgi:hypothetical protein